MTISLPPNQPMQRVVLVIQYVGTYFHGWQRQLNHRTVQEEIETAIASVLGNAVVLHGSGRTDTGVHAAAQVAHFDAPYRIPAHRWAAILNSRLSEDVVITASAQVPSDWHARFSAVSRRYRYTIYTGKRPNLFVKPFSWHIYRVSLSAELMRQALMPMLGRQHLSAFHRAGSSRPHSWVDVQDVSVVEYAPFIQIEVQCSGFLYGMMRLLVGMLVEVGSATRSPESFTDIWKQERRQDVRYAAPPQGLCLLRVTYPEFPLPPVTWFDVQPSFVLPTFDESSAEPLLH
jgi:tRNA pseudouridine38-40 synthase